MHHDRYGIFLHRGRPSVIASVDVLCSRREEPTLFEGGQVSGRVPPGNVDRDVIVAIKVDADVDSLENGVLIFGRRGRDVYFAFRSFT